jgi:hypothetical protein
MKPPILVVTDDVEIFDTVRSAERSLEPQDIHRTAVYDRDGLRIVPEVSRRGLANVVALRETNERIGEPELRQHLTRFLRTHQRDALPSDCTLDQLWESAEKHVSS